MHTIWPDLAYFGLKFKDFIFFRTTTFYRPEDYIINNTNTNDESLVSNDNYITTNGVPIAANWEKNLLICTNYQKNNTIYPFILCIDKIDVNKTKLLCCEMLHKTCIGVELIDGLSLIGGLTNQTESDAKTRQICDTWLNEQNTNQSCAFSDIDCKYSGLLFIRDTQTRLPDIRCVFSCDPSYKFEGREKNVWQQISSIYIDYDYDEISLLF
jgi:hypothetical protein